ncbi:MAG TPA: hypothetical protein VKB12_09185 [Pyrinomonadaceae bacterium]|nr:hypothetical protein [Pyrinomonadaceae bacterium]
MKKLAGLLAFAVALAGAILVTQYYTAKPKPPAPPLVAPAPPAPPPPADVNTAVFLETKFVTLDLASKKASVTLSLERSPASPAPERVWVWAYFFTQETAGKYCEGGPVEVKRPFDSGSRARVTVELPVANCPAPRTPSTTFYARVNVSSESSFAARLVEQRISYDITQASPVMLRGARR